MMLQRDDNCIQPRGCHPMRKFYHPACYYYTFAYQQHHPNTMLLSGETTTCATTKRSPCKLKP
eukprot:scaffold27380_cov19-Prasinocladus_malaysianus.AAC.2